MNPFGLPISIGANAFFSALLHWEAIGAQSVVTDVVGKVITGTTNVDLGKTSWFSSVTHQMFPVEELIVAPLLFAATIGAIFRQDMRRLARAWGVCLPISMIAGYAVIQLTATGLTITDAISSAIQYQVMPGLGAVLVNAINLGIAASLTDGMLSAIISLLIVAGCLAIWLELLLRAAAIELAVFFMPLALAGLVWPATAHWAKRLAHVLTALLLTKPVIVGALCLGAGAVEDVNDPSAAVGGLAILLIAAFAPFALFKLVPMVEVAAIAHLEGLSRRPFRAMEQSVQRVMSGVAEASAAARVLRGREGNIGELPDVAGQLIGQLSRGPEGPDVDPLGPAGAPKSISADSQPKTSDG
ncbi:MAG TPA: hypothetical protein VEJ84_16300 [Acidimicrobiales bacterium]|nr:hypothetical protein [Acidimicrobiales bacterium]